MAAPLDLDQLRTFVAIVDTGSFTRAADEVFKTQSAVSMQMRKLEDRLGVQLFERTGRNVRLSDEGSRLLIYARKMMSLSIEALSAFDEEQIEGHVRIGLPDDYAERLLPEIMARFSRSNPKVELQIACEPSINLIEHVEKGHLDVALVCVSRSAQAEIVRREPLHFVTSAAHDVHLEPVLPLAIGRSDCQWRTQCIDALKAIGRPHRILFTSWSATIVTSAVLSGLAVSVLPECALRSGMRVLGEADGFPTLPDAEIGMLRGKTSDKPVIDALVSHIRDSLENLAQPAEPPATRRLPEARVIRAPRPRPSMAAAGW
ncbi:MULTISPECIES: LysR family transcriptional regulator [unclassified Aureimonas]|uniref:LysR family transcriptional regulator n=1 Tax=unclassified Aureimonas TaxID=2615206 RepID=UPI0006FDB9ED|nr:MULTISPECIES: LysR family transcriptional regulator [unclassified Aureimonas]KQT70060.1 LysR family transcriptional regulator [Aureimonas sp. Leaf427]KQT76296.1 LysR family transcriptional regulator [Aureimonas sp. Leaf460]